MRLQRVAFTVHRVLSYVVFTQVVVWVLGGCVFAVLPHDSVVKGGAYAKKPAPVLPSGWPSAVAALPESLAAGQVTSFVGPQGPTLRVKGESATTCVLTNGGPWRAPDSSAIAAFAATIYGGPGRLVAIERRERAARRLGIVVETGDRRDLWSATYDDRLHTRLWFDGPTGEYLTVRNDAWVFYDFFWRLHLMDYTDGENVNTPWLRVLALLALGFAISGAVLTWYAAKRALFPPKRRATAAG